MYGPRWRRMGICGPNTAGEKGGRSGVVEPDLQKERLSSVMRRGATAPALKTGGSGVADRRPVPLASFRWTESDTSSG